MKEYITINDTKYDVKSFSTSGTNIVKITFSENTDIKSLISNMDIFKSIKMYTQGGLICGEWSDYITLYLQTDNSIQLSNDGSVYVEPEKPTKPNPKPEPEEPKKEETLEDVKKDKINELSENCKQLIYSGVTVDIDGVAEHFSYKTEDQTNIKDACDYAKTTGLSVPYHADNTGCKLYTPEQIMNIYIAEKTNLTNQETYFNQLKIYVMSLDNIDDVKNVLYGQDLTGEYLENYNTVMTQAGLIIQAYFGGDSE